MSKNIRVRFAPAPTGFMHIGNVRTALLNHIFALQNNGTFVLRIEDTDPQRNFDPKAEEIIKDLTWLNINYNEGPNKEGSFGPYFQSQRSNLYQEYLEKIAASGHAYKCFCTNEELEKKRNRQIALKQPPRYDKTCLKLTPDEINKKTNEKVPFIWRFKVEPNQEINLCDLSKGVVHFNTSNLTDFPLTRQDGSFTFLFANAIDDILMQISHVFRGEDHLSNSANQLLIYRALNASEPKFLHMPIICNTEGKKLSKRDAGFSLKDLQKDGFLPEAINNYLAILGRSFEEEILTVEEIAKIFNFESSSASQIKYDIEKLKWINQKWISRLSLNDLIKKVKPILNEKYPNLNSTFARMDSTGSPRALVPSSSRDTNNSKQTIIEDDKLHKLVELIQPELVTLNDILEKTEFFFAEPKIKSEDLVKIKKYSENKDLINNLVSANLNLIDSPAEFMEKIKSEAKSQNIPIGTILPFLRLAISGAMHGPNLADIINLIGKEKTVSRLKKAIQL